jgi:hypothetical protein
VVDDLYLLTHPPLYPPQADLTPPVKGGEARRESMISANLLGKKYGGYKNREGKHGTV